MYNFKHIKASYGIDLSTIDASGRISQFSRMIHLQVKNLAKEGYFIQLSNSSNEKIDGKELADFDAVMLRLGKSVYPVEIQMNHTGEFTDVLNYPEMKSRWESESVKILEELEGAFWVKRYIDLSAVNLKEKHSVLKSLQRDSFFQFYFHDRAVETWEIVLYNFPRVGINVSFALVLKAVKGYHYSYEGAVVAGGDECVVAGWGVLSCKYSEAGYLSALESSFRIEVADKGYYQKSVNISVKEGSGNIKSKGSLFSQSF